MSLEAMQEGIDWDFETFPDYMNSLERRGLVPNVAAFCGHSSVRTWVLGSEAPDRTATAEEVAEMKKLVLEALEAVRVSRPRRSSNTTVTQASDRRVSPTNTKCLS